MSFQQVAQTLRCFRTLVLFVLFLLKKNNVILLTKGASCANSFDA